MASRRCLTLGMPPLTRELRCSVNEDAASGGAAFAEHRERLQEREELAFVLERFELEYELRTTSPEKIVYKVNVPFEVDTETVTNAILALDRKMPPTVKWDDKAIKAK